MEITAKHLLTLAPFPLYFAMGIWLTERAQQHLREPEKHFWFSPMYQPDLFTDEGNRLRVKALRFWVWGGVAVTLYRLLL